MVGAASHFDSREGGFSVTSRQVDLHIRARHTTTRLIPAQSSVDSAPRYLRVIAPARDGDAHLVDEALRTLCGQDASTWKRVTSQRWLRLGRFRCSLCERAVTSPTSG
jgi:hypothetical protein